jgi:allantoinase
VTADRPRPGTAGAELSLVVRAVRAVVDGREQAVEIGVSDGRIAVVRPLDGNLDGERVFETAPDEVLLPGLVDSHVHLCDPGNTDWEDLEHATSAAAAAGVTTLVDMPIDSIPATTSVEALEIKRRAAEGRIGVDLAYWGGLVPGNLPELRPMLQAGVAGFKAFLADTGDPDFPPVSLAEIEAALRELRAAAVDDRDPAPLLVHAESAEVAAQIPITSGPRYRAYLDTRPRRIENEAIAGLLGAARRTGGRVHLVHLSSSDALPTLAAARADGVRISIETCPHYLALSAEEIADGATAFKCSPPVREASNRELLWAGLREGVIDQIASDHSPSTPQMKEVDCGDFATAWGGISSLQLAPWVVWTEAARRGFALPDLVRWMSERPARLAGLESKGSIREGADADFAVVAPDATFVVEPGALRHKNKLTPYAGRTLRGVVRRTIVRGETVWAAGADAPLPARGRTIAIEHRGVASVASALR